MAEVEFLITKGVRNIDVGCMQINPRPIPTLSQPSKTPSIRSPMRPMKVSEGHAPAHEQLVKATGSYHSMTPHLGIKYRAKVGRIWNELRGQPTPVIKTSKRNNANDQADEKPKARRYRSSEINYRRLNRLNQNFRQRRGLSRR